MAMIAHLLLLFPAFSILYGQSTCRVGFQYDSASNLCYVASSGHATFYNAVENCALIQAALPVIHNSAVLSSITRIAYQSDPDYLWYIGLRRVTGDVFSWLDQSPIDFTAWVHGQPAQGLGLNCVSNYAQTGITGWRVGACSDTLPYICVYTPAVPPTSLSPSVVKTTTGSPVGPNTCPPSTYSGNIGIIFSPGFQLNQQYGNNLNCQYHITVEIEYCVMLVVSSFDTESCCDHLRLYDGPTTSGSGSQFAKWSGTKLAGTRIQSSGNVLTASFQSDSSFSRAGFSIQYSQTISALTTPSQPHCNQHNYTGSTGTIQSPNFPSPYWNSMNCVYHIYLPDSSKAVQLSFLQFNTESGFDFVRIYDGTAFSSQLIVTLTGAANTSIYTSHSNSMAVTFSSDISNVAAGFVARYHSVTPPSTVPPTTTTFFPPTPPSPQCGADFYFDISNNECFHYDYNQLSFSAAQAACVSKGAQLLSIHSQNVENFTKAYIQESTSGIDRFYTWIGLKAMHGQFANWIDGSAVDYTRWESAQPDLNYGQCVAFQAWSQQGKASGWRTLPCSFQRPYICIKSRLFQ